MFICVICIENVEKINKKKIKNKKNEETISITKIKICVKSLTHILLF